VHESAVGANLPNAAHRMKVRSATKSGNASEPMLSAAHDRFCSLMGQGREAFVGVNALGMPAFSGRSFGA
jgi:hypothetical protein